MISKAEIGQRAKTGRGLNKMLKTVS